MPIKGAGFAVLDATSQPTLTRCQRDDMQSLLWFMQHTEKERKCADSSKTGPRQQQKQIGVDGAFSRLTCLELPTRCWLESIHSEAHNRHIYRDI